MPIATVPQNVTYKGMLNVSLTRVADTSGLSSGGFTTHSLVAMSTQGKWDTVGLSWVGNAGAVFDATIGNTEFDLGNVVPATNGNWQGALWDPDTQEFKAPVGFALSGSGASQPLDQVTEPLALTGGTVIGNFNPALLFTLPAGANTQWPEPNSGGGWWPGIIGGDKGQILFWRNLLIRKTSFWNSGGGYALLEDPSNIVFNSGGIGGCRGIIPYGGTNWIAADPKSVIQTDFNYSAVNYQLTFDSPDGVFDMQSAITWSGLQITKQGFLWLSKTNVTIGGVNMNGYAVMVNPDGTKYWIINFDPLLSGAAAWNGTGGNTAAMDKDGHIFIKRTSSPNQAYISDLVNLQPQTISYPSLPIIGMKFNAGLYK